MFKPHEVWMFADSYPTPIGRLFHYGVILPDGRKFGLSVVSDGTSRGEAIREIMAERAFGSIYLRQFLAHLTAQSQGLPD